jgi:hypothetical protein
MRIMIKNKENTSDKAPNSRSNALLDPSQYHRVGVNVVYLEEKLYVN